MSEEGATRTSPIGFRAYLGGFALMFLAFGAWTWINGRDFPWGYQQIGGTIAFGVGLILLVLLRLLRRTRRRTPSTS